MSNCVHARGAPATLCSPIYWIFVGSERWVEQSEELLPLCRALVRSSGLGVHALRDGADAQA